MSSDLMFWIIAFMIVWIIYVGVWMVYLAVINIKNRKRGKDGFCPLERHAGKSIPDQVLWKNVRIFGPPVGPSSHGNERLVASRW